MNKIWNHISFSEIDLQIDANDERRWPGRVGGAAGDNRAAGGHCAGCPIL